MLPETRSEEKVFIKHSNGHSKVKSSLFNPGSLLFAGIASLLYLLVSYSLLGFKVDQFILVGIFNFCYFTSRITRNFITGFSIFIIYWIIFDYMKVFPNYLFNEVHIESLYQLEKSLFGIEMNGAVLTPNEYFALHPARFMDVLAGVFYLCWIPIPLSFAAFLFFRKRTAFFQFALNFFLVNCIGFIGYYLYPAAPPWYVAKYGFTFNAATPGNTGALNRFDNYFGISVFENMYAKSSNVFAAMPSMHAAFMLLVLFYGIKYRLKYWNILFAIILVGIWFSAVYTSHHYILDVIAGILSGFIAIGLIQWWMANKSGRKAMQFMVSISSK